MTHLASKGTQTWDIANIPFSRFYLGCIVCNLDLWRECILYLNSDQQHYDDTNQKIVESSKFDKSCHIFILYQQQQLYHVYIISSYRLKWNISYSWGGFRLWEYSSKVLESSKASLSTDIWVDFLKQIVMKGTSCIKPQSQNCFESVECHKYVNTF